MPVVTNNETEKSHVVDMMSSFYLPSFYLCPPKGSALPWQDVRLPPACVFLLFGSTERDQSMTRTSCIIGFLFVLFT